MMRGLHMKMGVFPTAGFWRRVECLVLTAALLAAVLVPQGPLPVHAQDNTYYVSASSGDDQNGDGSFANPWKTIQRAGLVLQPGDTCEIRGGTYRETVTPANSGTDTQKITYRAYGNEDVVITGTDLVTGWTLEEGSIYQAPVPWTLGLGNQVFANDQVMDLARWPNNTGTLMEPTFARVEVGTHTTLKDSQLPGYAGQLLAGARIWYAGGPEWVGFQGTVSSFDEASKTLTIMPSAADSSEYNLKQGNPYYIQGNRCLLDAEREWWYDQAQQRMHLYAPGGVDPNTMAIEVKRRFYSFDLAGKSNIVLDGLDTHASIVNTTDSTSRVTLRNMKMSYVAHSLFTGGYAEGVHKGMSLNGSFNEMNSCEVAYSASPLLNVTGSDNRVINCHLHDGNYAATWHGSLNLSGDRHLISHNTINSTAKGIVPSCRDSIIEHNDIYDFARIISDLGGIYIADHDGQGTEIRYNKVHDAQGNYISGIYLDAFTSNFLVHHNVIWDMGGGSGINVNNPDNYHLVFNNTCGTGTGNISTYGLAYDNDLYGTRIYNNILAGELESNMSKADLVTNLEHAGADVFADASLQDFSLHADSIAIDMGTVIPGITDGHAGAAPDIGAYEYGVTPFSAGHDFASPPQPVFQHRETTYANRVRNGGFEIDGTYGWVTSGNTEVTEDNPWTWSTSLDIRNQHHGIKLAGNGLAEQTITGLTPNTAYDFNVWMKARDSANPATAGVKAYGGQDMTATVSSTQWTSRTIRFMTGASNTSATVYVMNPYVIDDNAIVETEVTPLATVSVTGAGIYAIDVTEDVQSVVSGDLTASYLFSDASTLMRIRSSNHAGKAQMRIETDQGEVRTVQVAEDTFVDSAYPDVNFDDTQTYNGTWFSGDSLQLNSDPNAVPAGTREAYMKFDLSALGLQGNITNAVLNVTVSYVWLSGTCKVSAISHDSWQEDSLTWSGRPVPAGSLTEVDAIGSSVITGAGLYAIDVTDNVRTAYATDRVASYLLNGASTLMHVANSSHAGRARIEIVTDRNTTYTVNVTEDTYVNDAYPGTNFNTNQSQVLELNQSPTTRPPGIREGYMKFDLEALTLDGAIVSAVLRYRVTYVWQTGTLTCNAISNDLWREDTLTWNRRPLPPVDPAPPVLADDAGLTLALGQHQAIDMLKSTILKALSARQAAPASMPAVVSGAFASEIEVARLVAADPDATLAEVDAAAASLALAEGCFKARSTLAGEIETANGLFADAAVGTDHFQYPAAAKTLYGSVIAQAQAVLELPGATQAQVEAMTTELVSAGMGFRGAIILPDIDHMTRVPVKGMLGNIGGFTPMVVRNGDDTDFTETITRYTAQTFDNELVAFDMTYQGDFAWPGFLLRSQVTQGYPWSSDSDYFIIFNGTNWEAQKWIDGKQAMYHTFPNTLLKQQQVSYRVVVGAVRYEVGGRACIRLLCYVDGEKAFDFLDTENPLLDPGYFAVCATSAGDLMRLRAENTCPVLAGIGDREIDEGERLQFHVTGVDPEGDDVLLSASNLPDGAVFIPETGMFSWMPDHTQSGAYQVSFSAGDASLVDTETITVTVHDCRELDPLGTLVVTGAGVCSFDVTDDIAAAYEGDRTASYLLNRASTLIRIAGSDSADKAVLEIVTEQGTTYAVDVSEDTFVHSAYPNTNFDDAKSVNGEWYNGNISLKYDPVSSPQDIREGYLKFDLHEVQLDGNIASAVLRMKVTYVWQGGYFTVNAITEDGWQEDELVWDNKPDLAYRDAATAPLGTCLVAGTGTASLDVTGDIQSAYRDDGVASYLFSDASTLMKIASTNSANRALVEITTDQGTMYSVYATEDAYAYNAYPDTNFDDSRTLAGTWYGGAYLQVKHDPVASPSDIMQGYVKFDLGTLALDGDIVSAVLKVHVVYVWQGGHFTVRHVANDAWGEDTLTWNNRPAP